MTEKRATRVVRTYGMDLAQGDVIVEGSMGGYIGTVVSEPVYDVRAATVKFDFDTPAAGVRTVTWRDTRVVRIEIPRGKSGQFTGEWS